MKITENKPKSIHLRFSNSQFEFLVVLSEEYQMSINDLIRTFVDEKRVLCRAGERPYANHKNNIKYQL